MKRGKLTNREIDELGKRLVRAGKATDSEIDNIVSDPRLFNGVLTKIAVELEAPRKSRPRFGWKPAVATAAVLVFVSVSLLGYFRFSGTGEPIVSKPRVLPPIYVVNEKPFKPDIKLPEPEQPANDRPKAVHAIMTKPVEDMPAPKVRGTQTAPVQQAEQDFHPIGFRERAEDAAIDGRIVRVEMPRSALFALGVDLPLENGTRAVKADLLVGADGIPRGIRLVD